jgi:tetratricopeptide (TPR) repeat protein
LAYFRRKEPHPLKLQICNIFFKRREKANKVKIVKWFLAGSACLLCSAAIARGDASMLYNQGQAAMSNQQYDVAAQAFDGIINGYPTFQYIDDVRLEDGQAYFYAGKYKEAIDRLAKAMTSQTHPELKPEALYWTALSQFSAGEKSSDQASYGQAITSFSSLIDLIGKMPEAKDRLESSYYYRAIASYERNDYANAEKDLLLLTGPQFTASLTRPDYLVLLGEIYQVEANNAVKAKKPEADIRALADKALQAFDQVARDPNALVQANDAYMSQADVLFLIAPLDPGTAGYEKSLDAYRKVRREADLVPIQQQRLDQLHQQAQAQASALAAQPGARSNSSNDLSLLIQREQNKLDKLKTGPDPIIQALIGIANCYAAMKQPDETRTILHRLIAHATLTADQQKAIDRQMLFSYAFGGQTDQADKALTDYLAKHPGDSDVDSISVQVGGKLLDQKDFNGALAQADRSLKDFPSGRFIADAITLKARALTGLGRKDDSNKVIDDYLKANPNSPEANNLLLSRAPNEASEGDLPGALADYKRVRDNTAAGVDMQSAAGAGYIQTLSSQRKWDDVITESKAYEAKFPNAKALPSVIYFGTVALSQKKDPGAIAALQDIAKKYPKEEVAPFALTTVVTIYKDANNIPAMIQAASDLRAAYPDSYGLIASTNGLVSDVLIKQKRFDDAIALYQPLTKAPKADVAAAAGNNIGDIWADAAKSLGYYQSMALATRGEADKRLASAEQAYLGTLKNYPDELKAVGGAFEGIVRLAKQRRSWGLLKDPDMEGYLTLLSTDFTAPEMQARFEMAKAGLVFSTKEGAKQYPAALDRFHKVIAANPNLPLTRQETNQYGELLLATKDYTAAAKVYGDLLATAGSDDEPSKGDAYYGLGASALGLNELAKAKDYFMQLKGLSGGGMWHPHIQEANYAIALANEESTDPTALAAAKDTYASLMSYSQGGPSLQAKAMLGYGRLLEKSGNVVKPTDSGPNENAIHYYQEPHTIFGPASPEESAEGLYDAGQAYEKLGDKANAKKQFDDLIKTYGVTAPDWVAKAQAAVAQG